MDLLRNGFQQVLGLTTHALALGAGEMGQDDESIAALDHNAERPAFRQGQLDKLEKLFANPAQPALVAAVLGKRITPHFAEVEQDDDRLGVELPAQQSSLIG